ncbi:hypothetical protein LOD99_6880 [Oopsacas minuta]|uniref:Uncharacterized protein n=1 Tax=Oopsacas minuta TaxID=111878 RepID=A0AAV7JJX5_9METZ|nr:hypothetical protein LOD99_6880 [Oopsacas minuta]
MEENGILLSQGLVRIKLLRTMFDGKMAGILSGAGGAHCQLCIPTFKQLHDVELIRDGFPINRSITSAKELFQSVNEVEFLSLSSNDRLGLTHQPISDIDIICSSPLHSYLCIFRWFMTVVYHLQSGARKWSPSSLGIKNSMKFVSGLLMEKTGMKIDQPSSDGGTTSTGNVARNCFLDKNQFLYWVCSLIPTEYHENIKVIHTNLSVCLRIYNSDREINTERLDILCKDTYEYIVIRFPWANISPTLHKLLAHSSELIRTCNNSHGLKVFSEEAVEVSNKLVRSWFLILICHLQCGAIQKWSPTSPIILGAKKFITSLIEEKLSISIDTPSVQGGTTTTGNVVRRCFTRSDDTVQDFLYWVLTVVPQEIHQVVTTIFNNLSAILRLYNSNRKVDTEGLDNVCRETYESILTNFSWAQVTPTLHKLLAHAPQIIADHNDGFGLEDLSEEGLESCNKLVRRYHERLSRKFSFEDNVKDVFVRLISQSDPILASFRNITKNDSEPDLSELKSCQDILVKSLIINTL